MRFSDVIQGKRQRKLVTLPLQGATLNEKGEWEGPTVKLDIAALKSDEYTEVVVGARAYAAAKGAPDDDELLERGRQLYTLLIACLDVDHPSPEEVRFFQSVDEIDRSPSLGPELIAFLYEEQQFWQDDVNPLRKNLTPDQFVLAIAETARGNLGFFAHMRPAMRWSFTHSMAKLLAASMKPVSQPSSSSAPPEQTETG